MYTPSFYVEKNIEAILALIERYGFATLLTSTGGNGSTESVSHLPFIAEKNSNGEIELLCHMAKANPHWHELEKFGKAKVIFTGPHAYISPAWYQPKSDNVPTWSYAVVHAVGKFEIVSDVKVALSAMDRLVSSFESHYETNWQLPVDEPDVAEMMNHIVVFKITDIEFKAKFKLNQKQDSVDRNNVIEQLSRLGDSGKAMSDYIKRS